MTIAASPDPTLNAAPRIGNSTLVLVRWLAITGQASALLLAQFVLHINVPLAAGLGCIGLSALLNLTAARLHGRNGRLSARAASLYLAYDIIQLSTLLYLTGGLENPFAVLIIAPLIVGASLLGLRYVLCLGGLTLSAIILLAFFYIPLNWPSMDGQGLGLQDAGVLIALGLSAVFIAAYVWRTALDARRVQNALHATQLALLRQQQITALGAQAAAAAHELGSPLNTIFLIARELEKTLHNPEQIAPDDIVLLASQAERCKTILEALANPKPDHMADAMPALPPAAFMEVVSQPYRQENPAIRLHFTQRAEDDSPPPYLRPSPELMHGLGNLVQNAIEHGFTRVDIECKWSKNSFSILIHDDGVGFSSSALSKIGEPYISTKKQAGNMGLGLFISKALLEMTGAHLRFANHKDGGAMIEIIWRRDDLRPFLSDNNG